MAQKTIFNINRSQFNKKTIDLINENLTVLKKEVEIEIYIAWGLEVE